MLSSHISLRFFDTDYMGLVVVYRKERTLVLGGDVAELVHEYTFGTQTMLNVYFFEAVDGTAALIDLAGWFNSNVVPDIKALQPDTTTHVELRLRNLFDDAEVYDLALSGTGSIPTASDNPLPSFVSTSLRLLHAQGNLRSGWKRIQGGTESYADGGVWSAAYQTLVDNVGGHLVNPLTPTLATWAHVVVGRIKYTTPDGSVAYRLPSTQAEAVIGYPTSYVTGTRLTTQNSRKWYTS